MESMKEQSSRHFYVSFLNVCSCIAVVVLHANGSFWRYRNDFSWAINNFIECVFYFAVPIFFMLIGVTLFDYPDKYDTKLFAKKRIQKTVVPFLFWSSVAFILKSIKDPEGFFINELEFDKLFNGIFCANYVSYYWFFVPLFCIYLSIPLFANIDKKKKYEILKYLACIAFVCDVLIPFLISCNIFGWDISWNYNIPVMSGYLLYPTLGYLLHHCSLNKKQRVGIYIVALVGLALHCLGTYYLSQRQGEIIGLYKGYLNLPCVLYSVGVFVFVKYAVSRIREGIFTRFIYRFQDYTLAIYLLHGFVFDIVSRLLHKLHVYNTSSVLYVVLMTVINISSCIIITFILRKVLKLKVIVP